MNSRSSDLTHGEIAAFIGVRDPIILEIGANDGTDSIEFLRRYPRCRLFCWEPDQRAIGKWRASVNDPRAVLYECALDEKPGTAIFHPSSGTPPGHVGEWDKSGSLCAPTGHILDSPWCKFERTFEVVTATLDGCMAELWPAWLGTIDFIHIDVQGAERRVFAGGKETLKRTRYVRAENHPTEQYAGQWTDKEMVSWFEVMGFSCLGRFANDLLLCNEAFRG
jgi:FkbM family methyltransferase